MNIDQFLTGYIDAALWAELCADGVVMDSRYSRDDIDADALAVMRADCARFLAENAQDLEAYAEHRAPLQGYNSAELAGHDFWLTRNRHGVGFWDRGLPDGIGERLTNSAHAFGECDICEGDDGRLYA